MIFLPALRFFTGPVPPGALAARFLAAVIRPPLLFFIVVTPSFVLQKKTAGKSQSTSICRNAFVRVPEWLSASPGNRETAKIRNQNHALVCLPTYIGDPAQQGASADLLATRAQRLDVVFAHQFQAETNERKLDDESNLGLRPPLCVVADPTGAVTHLMQPVKQ